MIRKGLSGVLLFIIIWSSGCKTTTGPQFDPRAEGAAALADFTPVPPEQAIRPDWLQPPTDLFTLGPGDQIEIELFGDEPYRNMSTVGPDGRIYFYLLPGLDVWGLTLGQTQELIQREMGEFFEGEPPAVGITLRRVDSKRIWLLGRLRNAGVYPMTTPMTLLEAISLAGGPMTSSESGSTVELADLGSAFLIRDGERLPVDFEGLIERGNMAHNIYVEPDDFIYVPSALTQEIYVLGAVRTPQTIAAGGRPTLATAIAAAGGTVQYAYRSHVAIVRGSLSDPQIAIVDFGDISRGRAPDVPLEPRDIVYVPFSPYRVLARYLDVVLTTFVRAVAVNEGARAVRQDAIAVGVGIPIGFPQFGTGTTVNPGTTTR